MRSDEDAAQTDLDRAADTHELDQDLADDMIRFAFREYGNDWLLDCLESLGFDTEEVDESCFQLVVPVAIYHLRKDGRTVAELYLERRSNRLAGDAPDWIAAQQKGWFSIWEVQAVDPGKSVTLTDLLSGETRLVHEQRGSRLLVKRDAILARVADYNGICVIVGSHPSPLPPEYAAACVSATRRALRWRKAKISVEKLREEATAIVLAAGWNRALEEMENRPLPTLQNTDGDPLLFTTDKYRIVAGARDAVEHRLGALPGVNVEQEERGSSRFVFTRPGNKQHKSWENTVVGQASVSRSDMRVETNSLKRADALRKQIEQLCGDTIRHVGRSHSDPKSLIGKGPRADHPPEETPPELLPVLMKIRSDHMKAWMDESVPALGGRTPRQAATDPKWRPRLDVLLKQFERDDARRPAVERLDYATIHRELGLD
jgi:hypothetical protein